MLTVKRHRRVTRSPLTTPAESQEALLEIVNETRADPDALATCKV